MFVIDVVRNNQMPNLSSLYQAERTARYEEFTPFLLWAIVEALVQTPSVISIYSLSPSLSLAFWCYCDNSV